MGMTDLGGRGGFNYSYSCNAVKRNHLVTLLTHVRSFQDSIRVAQINIVNGFSIPVRLEYHTEGPHVLLEPALYELYKPLVPSCIHQLYYS